MGLMAITYEFSSGSALNMAMPEPIRYWPLKVCPKMGNAPKHPSTKQYRKVGHYDKAVKGFLDRHQGQQSTIGMGYGKLGQYRRYMASQPKDQQAKHQCSVGCT